MLRKNRSYIHFLYLCKIKGPLQMYPFWLAKGLVLHSKRTRFATQKESFWKAIGNKPSGICINITESALYN